MKSIKAVLILFPLAAVLLFPQVVSADTVTMDFKAWIDGESLLLIQGDTLQWHNLSWNVPGYEYNLLGNPQPTYIETSLNGGPVMDLAWNPTWPPNPYWNVYSATFTGLDPTLPNSDLQDFSLQVISARENFSYVLPSSSNGYTMTLDFDDRGTGSAAWYEVQFSFDVPNNNTAVPEPASLLLLGSGLGALGLAAWRRRK